MKDFGDGLCCGLILTIFASLAMGAVGGCEGREQIRREAVRNKVATYESNDSGNPEFKWLTVPAKPSGTCNCKGQ